MDGRSARASNNARPVMLPICGSGGRSAYISRNRNSSENSILRIAENSLPGPPFLKRLCHPTKRRLIDFPSQLLCRESHHSNADKGQAGCDPRNGITLADPPHCRYTDEWARLRRLKDGCHISVHSLGEKGIRFPRQFSGQLPSRSAAEGGKS